MRNSKASFPNRFNLPFPVRVAERKKQFWRMDGRFPPKKNPRRESNLKNRGMSRQSSPIPGKRSESYGSFTLLYSFSSSFVNVPILTESFLNRSR